MNNPYDGIDTNQLWLNVVQNVAPEQLDPVIAAKFKISKTDRIATAGAEFAEYVSNYLKNLNFNYFVAESGAEISDEAQRREKGYGQFSARYAHIFTARQLVQLFSEALGAYISQEKPWQRPDGRFVDPFRPYIEPEGFAEPADVAKARQQHLAAVREMFLKADVFIFTLSLTEGWVSQKFGEVFPLAPGVLAGDFDSSTYRFKNFSVNEVLDDMQIFFGALKKINPKIKVILSVSPIPLLATYEKKHVLTANTYSQSVLRVAAEMLASQYDWVDYFPAFEIVTGVTNHAVRYIANDGRTLTPQGVNHVLQCFGKHYLAADAESN